MLNVAMVDAIKMVQLLQIVEEDIVVKGIHQIHNVVMVTVAGIVRQSMEVVVNFVFLGLMVPVMQMFQPVQLDLCHRNRNRNRP